MDSFIELYKNDFNNLDAKSISSWYEFPISVLTPSGNSIFNSDKEFIDSVTSLLNTYQTFNFSHALILSKRVTKGLHGLHQIDVSWRLINKSNEPIIDFDISYIFKIKDENVIICGVISHNEFSEWKRISTRNI